MKLGCCVNMVAEDAFKIGYDRIPALDALGYDYVELPLAQLMGLDSGRRADIRALLDGLRISCESCNNFFPASVRITGPEADLQRAAAYADEALCLAEALGAKVVVFGSSGAKNVPEGFPQEAAYEQIAALLRAISPMLERRGITAVIEPICHLEGNIILTAAEGLQLMADVGLDSVKLLADFYHMHVENEHIQILKQAGESLRHVHFADPEGRAYPTAEKASFNDFFGVLKQISYEGRVSIEAYSHDFEADAAKALKILKGLIA